MLERISITNFQSLRAVHLILAPFTVIVGETDSGKSAFIRAVKAMVNNDSIGKTLRHGTKTCSVIITAEGRVAGWAKGKTVNWWVGEGDSRSDMTRTGVDVPPELQEVLRLTEVKLDDGTIVDANFQDQFEPPFLVRQTPAKIAKILGQLTNVSLLYMAVRQGIVDKHNNDDRLRLREEDLARLEEQLKTYSWLPDEKVLLGRGFRDLQEAVQLESQLEHLRQLKVRLYEVAGAVQAAREELGPKQDMAEKLRVVAVDVKRLTGDLNRLVDLRQVFNSAITAVKLAKGALIEKRERIVVADGILRKHIEAIKVCPVCRRPLTAEMVIGGHVHDTGNAV